LCTLLPLPYAERLAAAAEAGDWLAIDRTTDELVRDYPDLVRPRHAVAPGFSSVADDRRGQGA
jgi:hypothetical protein